MSKPAAASLIAWRPIPRAQCTIEWLVLPWRTEEETTGRQFVDVRNTLLKRRRATASTEPQVPSADASNGDHVIIRPASPADHPALVDLLRTTMGWPEGPEGHRLWRWKHVDSPFGPSVMWMAEEGGRPIGVRPFMRWEFERGSSVVRAARAVDTATHPDHQGKGVFSTLTRAALDELRGDGVQFVFNTPNSQSLPGYLKLGWTNVGRLPVAVRPSSPAAVWRMLRSRVPAERESLDTTAGAPISDLLDSAQLGSLLADHRTGRGGLRTRRTVAYLQWRYGRPWLKYRAILGAHDVAARVCGGPPPSPRPECRGGRRGSPRVRRR